MTVPLPPNEAARLAALRQYNILDTLPEQDFDDLTALAAHICQAPIALITLIEADRQWFKSKLGLDSSQTPRELAFCPYTFADNRPLVVPDATQDARFAANPLVTGDLNIRFYAGAPLITPEGFALGTLCVVDRVPRALGESQLDALCALSRQVVAQLELRRALAEKRRGEAARAKLAAIVQNSQDAICSTDLRGIITTWNRSARRLFGYTEDEIIGQPLETLVPPDKAEEVEHMLQQLSRGTRTEHMETVRMTKSGRRLDVSITVSPIRDDAGLLIGSSHILADITDRKAAETELVAAKEAAEGASRAKTQFLANVTHELRTPLTAIIGYGEILQETAQAAGHVQYLTDLQRIASAGSHLLSLIDDLLDFARIEAGKMALNLETFDVCGVVSEVSDLIRPIVGKNHNGLDVQCPAAVGRMTADLRKVRQVLYNLLSNSAKFTESGSIQLEVRRKWSAGREWILFEVSDTGIGMSSQQIEKLFEAFAQAEASIARKFGGTGLGLAISRQFCRLMGGDITVTSEPGEGSTFTIILPVKVEAPATA